MRAAVIATSHGDAGGAAGGALTARSAATAEDAARPAPSASEQANSLIIDPPRCRGRALTTIRQDRRKVTALSNGSGARSQRVKRKGQDEFATDAALLCEFRDSRISPGGSAVAERPTAPHVTPAASRWAWLKAAWRSSREGKR